jgi:hypothetical protein
MSGIMDRPAENQFKVAAASQAKCLAFGNLFRNTCGVYVNGRGRGTTVDLYVKFLNQRVKERITLEDNYQLNNGITVQLPVPGCTYICTRERLRNPSMPNI